MGTTKIGIYPGAFDPVHNGHVAFAEAAILKHNLDKVFFLPEPRPRHKQGVKALEHRTAMVELAIQGNAKLGLIVLEQQRFTVHETWPLLVSRFEGADSFMLLGSDVASRLASWPNIEELAKTAPRFIVALRGEDAAHMRSMLQTMRKVKKLDLHYSLIETQHSVYSSSKIRYSLKHAEAPNGVHPNVLQYISDQKLYISGAT